MDADRKLEAAKAHMDERRHLVALFARDVVAAPGSQRAMERLRLESDKERAATLAYEAAYEEWARDVARGR